MKTTVSTGNKNLLKGTGEETKQEKFCLVVKGKVRNRKLYIGPTS